MDNEEPTDKELKRGRTAMPAFSDQVPQCAGWDNRVWRTKKQRLEKEAHRNGRFPKSSPVPRCGGRKVVMNQKTET